MRKWYPSEIKTGTFNKYVSNNDHTSFVGLEEGERDGPFEGSLLGLVEGDRLGCEMRETESKEHICHV